MKHNNTDNTHTYATQHTTGGPCGGSSSAKLPSSQVEKLQQITHVCHRTAMHPHYDTWVGSESGPCFCEARGTHFKTSRRQIQSTLMYDTKQQLGGGHERERERGIEHAPGLHKTERPRKRERTQQKSERGWIHVRASEQAPTTTEAPTSEVSCSRVGALTGADNRRSLTSIAAVSWPKWCCGSTHSSWVIFRTARERERRVTNRLHKKKT